MNHNYALIILALVPLAILSVTAIWYAVRKLIPTNYADEEVEHAVKDFGAGVAFSRGKVGIPLYSRPTPPPPPPDRVFRKHHPTTPPPPEKTAINYASYPINTDPIPFTDTESMSISRFSTESVDFGGGGESAGGGSSDSWDSSSNDSGSDTSSSND